MEIKGQFEQSEEITAAARRFELIKYKQKKYRGCNECVVTAPGPLKLFPGARYSIDFVIDVAGEKYLDHQPLERQCRKMKREGLLVDSQTLWDYLESEARRECWCREGTHEHRRELGPDPMDPGDLLDEELGPLGRRRFLAAYPLEQHAHPAVLPEPEPR